MKKTCTCNKPCKNKYQDGSGFLSCNYFGYCDFQLPRDSRFIPFNCPPLDPEDKK